MTLTIELPIPPKELSPNGRCSFDGCTKPRFHRNRFCEAHAAQLKRKGNLTPLKLNCWTDEQLAGLREFYAQPMKLGDLEEFAKSLGKLKSNVSRKARAMGLTNRRREYGRKDTRVFKGNREAFLASVSARIKERFRVKGHPCGMKGKHHSQETRERLRITTGERNRNRTPDEVARITQKMMKTKFAKYGTLAPKKRDGTRWKSGWRMIFNRRIYFRSRWEYHYGLYLDWLKENKVITEWEHEPETFWFEGIKRGCVSYLPDFRVTNKDGSIEYHEVKGWMDDRSATKIKRMAKYHPNVKLVVIKADWFQRNGHILRNLPGYEF